MLSDNERIVSRLSGGVRVGVGGGVRVRVGVRVRRLGSGFG